MTNFLVQETRGASEVVAKLEPWLLDSKFNIPSFLIYT